MKYAIVFFSYYLFRSQLYFLLDTTDGFTVLPQVFREREKPA